ncbi:MAG: hypothetical protein IPO65_11970 [Saprospiraceae bacterium]|nr:hypothetical protein [Saprospiraceae bacterium]
MKKKQKDGNQHTASLSYLPIITETDPVKKTQAGKIHHNGTTGCHGSHLVGTIKCMSPKQREE